MRLLVLNATNQSIKAVLAGAVATTQPDFVTTYSDSSSTNFLEAPETGTLNNTTDVTIVSSPAASTNRLIKDINIYNRDTAAVTVTIKFIDGANTRILWKGTLQPGESKCMEGVYDTNGALKVSVPSVMATAIVGQVPVVNGGTGQDLSANTGAVIVTAGVMSANPTTGSDNSVRATSPSLTTPAIAGATLTGAIDANGATMRVPVTASALTATEGYFKWDSTEKLLKAYDGARDRGLSGYGWMPFATPPSYSATQASATAVNLAASNGGMLIPIFLAGHMLLQSVSLWNTDITLSRSWRWALYVDRGNASNSVDLVANSNASDTFAAAAASARTSAAASPPTYIPQGAYWLFIQNDGSNTFGVGTQAAGNGGMALPQYKTKNGAAVTYNPSTLDIITATWTAGTAVPAVRLNGRVAANTIAW